MNDQLPLVRTWRGPSLLRTSLCFALLATACSSSSTAGDASGWASGGTAGASGAATGTGGIGTGTTGGSGSGGALASGGLASGGAVAGGAASGGAASGGAASGGAASGGAASGGAASGGAWTGSGGAASGGAASGGAASGGAASGGAASGGAAFGGAASGGAASGGAAFGGAASGGAASGGAASGDAVPSPGCGKDVTLTFEAVPGESGSAVGFGEGGYVRIGDRGFALRLPDNYDKDNPYWLVFGFHWNGGNSKEVDSGGSNGYNMAHFGLQKLSNNGAIFVAPDGLNAGWGGDNLPFVDDMVELITENLCVDMTRLYTNGFSYGGGMSYAIACARAKVFRGAAIYEGAVLSGCDGGNDPIAYWQMAGTTDNTCTIDMATPMRDRFVENNGCTGPTTEPPRPNSISDDHICTDYTGCSSGHPLRWCVHPAGHGNAVVDGTADLWNTCATPPKTCSDDCPCTWVPEDVWTFFNSL